MSTSVALLLLMCSLGLWAVDYYCAPEAWGYTLLTQSLTLLNALLLCSLLYRAKASSRFSLLPAVLYLLAVAVFPFLRVHWAPQVPAMLVLLFLFFTHNIPDDHEPNAIVFFISLLLCLDAFVTPDALLCIVYLWVVVLIQGCLSLRTILASLLAAGLCGVYYWMAVIIGWAEPFDWMVIFRREWLALVQPVLYVASIGTMYVAFLCIASGAFRRSSYDLVSARMSLYHIVMLGLLSTPLILLAAAQQDSLALLPLSLAGVTGIYLLQKESESRGITLLIYIVGAVTMYLFFVLSL